MSAFEEFVDDLERENGNLRARVEELEGIIRRTREAFDGAPSAGEDRAAEFQERFGEQPPPELAPFIQTREEQSEPLSPEAKAYGKLVVERLEREAGSFSTGTTTEDIVRASIAQRTSDARTEEQDRRLEGLCITCDLPVLDARDALEGNEAKWRPLYEAARCARDAYVDLHEDQRPGWWTFVNHAIEALHLAPTQAGPRPTEARAAGINEPCKQCPDCGEYCACFRSHAEGAKSPGWLPRYSPIRRAEDEQRPTESLTGAELAAKHGFKPHAASGASQVVGVQCPDNPCAECGAEDAPYVEHRCMLHYGGQTKMLRPETPVPLGDGEADRWFGRGFETAVLDIDLALCRLEDTLDVWAPNLKSVARDNIVDSMRRYLGAVVPTGSTDK